MFTLADLDRIIGERASVTDGSSYTASLIEKGVEKCAAKLGEEATETVIAALGEDRDALIGESADLIYHLLVLLRSRGLALDDVVAELEKRTGQTGLEEKASRGK